MVMLSPCQADIPASPLFMAVKCLHGHKNFIVQKKTSNLRKAIKSKEMSEVWSQSICRITSKITNSKPLDIEVNRNLFQAQKDSWCICQEANTGVYCKYRWLVFLEIRMIFPTARTFVFQHVDCRSHTKSKNKGTQKVCFKILGERVKILKSAKWQGQDEQPGGHFARRLVDGHAFVLVTRSEAFAVGALSEFYQLHVVPSQLPFSDLFHFSAHLKVCVASIRLMRLRNSTIFCLIMGIISKT